MGISIVTAKDGVKVLVIDSEEYDKACDEVLESYGIVNSNEDKIDILKEIEGE
jgi:hypothetical protein